MYCVYDSMCIPYTVDPPKYLGKWCSVFFGSGHVEGLSSQQACPCPTFTASPEPGVLRCGAPDFIHMPT